MSAAIYAWRKPFRKCFPEISLIFYSKRKSKFGWELSHTIQMSDAKVLVNTLTLLVFGFSAEEISLPNTGVSYCTRPCVPC